MKKSIFDSANLTIMGSPVTGKSYWHNDYLSKYQEQLRREYIIANRNIKIDELLNGDW